MGSPVPLISPSSILYPTDTESDAATASIDDLTWIDARLTVGPWILGRGEIPRTNSYSWSLTQFHERLAERYGQPAKRDADQL